MLKCPFCGAETKTFYGLQKHMRKHIDRGYCPACEQHYNNIVHHFAMNRDKDDLHLILYAAFGRSKKGNKEFLKECRDKAVELLEG